MEKYFFQVTKKAQRFNVMVVTTSLDIAEAIMKQAYWNGYTQLKYRAHQCDEQYFPR